MREAIEGAKPLDWKALRRVEWDGEEDPNAIKEDYPLLCWIIVFAAVKDEEFRLKLCKDVLAAGADPNLATDKGMPPLHLSLYRGLEITKALLAAGADVHVRGRDGKTALHVAGLAEPAAILPLLRAGADLGATDQDGRTPQEVAVEGGKGRTFEMAVAAWEREKMEVDVARVASRGRRSRM